MWRKILSERVDKYHSQICLLSLVWQKEVNTANALAIVFPTTLPFNAFPPVRVWHVKYTEKTNKHVLNRVNRWLFSNQNSLNGPILKAKVVDKMTTSGLLAETIALWITWIDHLCRDKIDRYEEAINKWKSLCKGKCTCVNSAVKHLRKCESKLDAKQD